MTQRTETVTTLVPVPDPIYWWDHRAVQERLDGAFRDLLRDGHLCALAEPEWSREWLTPKGFAEVFGGWPSDLDMPAGAWRFTAEVTVDDLPAPAAAE